MATNDDDDTLARLNAAMPIAEDAVQLRVDPSQSWPEEIENDDAWTARQVFNAARDVFASYRAGRSLNGQNSNLTPEGALNADGAWVEKLPELQKQAVRLETFRMGLDDRLRKITEEALASPSDEDEGDKPKPSEVRAWLLTIPENERSDRVQSLIRKGDKLVLRAVLAAPTWMTGISQEELDALRDAVVRQHDPARHRRIHAMKKGVAAAERVLQGVTKFLRQDTTLDGRREREAASRPGLRRVG